MIAKFRSEKSEKGHSLDELKSALQKGIRRSNVRLALYAATELYNFKKLIDSDPRNVKRIQTNFIHRLMIIFLEDVGIGNYDAWEFVDRMIFQMLNNRDFDVKILYKLVITLCGSIKTRSCSHIGSLSELNTEDKWFYKHFYICETIDSLQGDGITGLTSAVRDKDTINAILHLKSLLKHKKNKEIINTIFNILDTGGNVHIIKRWWKELRNVKEQDLVLILPLIYKLYGSDKTYKCTKIPKIDIHKKYDKFPDYVYDKHVKRSINRTNNYFVNVSSIVQPESKIVPGVYKHIYKWIRLGKQKIHPLNATQERDFIFVSRIQLTCSKSKTDTYLITDYNEKLWFVKGPFKTHKAVDDFITIQGYKKKLNIPYNACYKRLLYANIWKKGVPLGVRNTLDKGKKWPFIICPCILNNITYIRKSSKLWPSTRVVKQNVNLDNLTDREAIDYLNLIAFRLKYNIGDFADRNFIKYNGRLYSVDEEFTTKKIILTNNFRGKRLKRLVKYFDKYKENIHVELRNNIKIDF